jgi:hypothetical protein
MPGRQACDEGAMRTAIGLAALFLAGCSWSDTLVTEIKSLPSDSSFGYRQGYLAGCKTGISRTGWFGFDKPLASRDEARIDGEPDYRKGWEDGAGNCAGRYIARVAPHRPPGR